MLIPFSKYTGCGNDFILIDNRTHLFPAEKEGLISLLCQKSNGIGSDGLILLENSTHADFRMRIFNSDGSEAEMCGNGIRCLARFIQELKFDKNTYTIQTMLDSATVTLDQDLVTVTMPKPFDIHWQQVLEIENIPYNFHFLNTGVPHAVLFVEDLDANKWMELAPKIRFHPRFALKGTNVNFAHIHEDEVRVRTYERGVEQETEACGTGATATALAAGFLYRLPSPIKVIPKSNSPLKISFNYADKDIFNVRMAGPAKKIFHGEFILD